MSTYTFLIIDDEPLARELIETYLEKLQNFLVVASCKSAIEASGILAEKHIDLLFLDIEMPQLKGTDFFKNLTYKPAVIFTTAYRDYAVDGFELNAIDYLLKPISFERFLQAIEKINKINYNEIDKEFSLKKEYLKKQETIFIKSGYDHIQVLISDIIAIKSDSDYTEIITKEKNYLSNLTLKYWIEKLNKKTFTQVHKSYIINVDKIQKISSNIIYTDSFEIPLGRAYKKIFSDQFLK